MEKNRKQEKPAETSSTPKIIGSFYFGKKLYFKKIKKQRKIKNIVLNDEKSLNLNFSNLLSKPLFSFD